MLMKCFKHFMMLATQILVTAQIFVTAQILVTACVNRIFH